MDEVSRICCPACGQPYNVRPEQWERYAGRSITCASCSKHFTLNMPAADAVAAHQETLAANGTTYQPVKHPAQPAADSHVAYPQATLRTNGMAIFSLICGILFFIPFSCLLAVTFGIISLRRARHPRIGGKRMAHAAILLGGLGIIISIVALFYINAWMQRDDCAAHLREIGQAIKAYAVENNGAYPPDLNVLAKKQSLMAAIFVCPASHQIVSTPNMGSYVYVGSRLTSYSPGDAVVVYESLDHHGTGMNVLYADGRVEFRRMNAEQVSKFIAKVRAATRP